MGPPGGRARSAHRSGRISARQLRPGSRCRRRRWGPFWSVAAGLLRFLDDPAVPIDNNATERSLRGVVRLVSLCAPSSSAGNRECSIIARIAGGLSDVGIGVGPAGLPGGPDRLRKSAREHRRRPGARARFLTGATSGSRDTTRPLWPRPRPSLFDGTGRRG
ncbi:MAG: transposase [Polyangiaceae bacterium]|nr:transposase [Polyangiaceae bacterium]MCB9609745.1 transposase [Polyangiaceae bacterium]